MVPPLRWRPALWRNLLVLAMGWLTGVSVALAGAIGFVGLVVPHLLRLSGISDHRYLLPAAALAGAAVLLAADILALVYFSTTLDLRQLMYWMMGGFGGVDWRYGWLILSLMPVIAALLCSARTLNLLALGETSARQLGLPLRGAGVGVVLGVLLGSGSLWSLALAAMAGALAITLILLHFAHRQLASSRLLLTGVALGIICSAVMTWVSLCAGERWLLPAEWFTPQGELFVWQIRLPRTLAVIATGAALALCGTVMQALFTNPLAEPGLLGVSNSAAFFITVPACRGWLSFCHNPSTIVTFSCLTASLMTLLDQLARQTGRRSRRTLLLLAALLLLLSLPG
ncbi:hypothetical protein CRX72_16075 [Pantoea sp. BRM17]|nr:hypothetical protein CRX72_16075 [Pantoea sp. BRM17]